MKYSLVLVLIVVISSCSYNTKDMPTPIEEPQVNTGGPNKLLIDASGMLFSPNSITISVGDTIEWRNTSGFHNVDGTQVTFPSNPDSFGNATANSPWTYFYVFNIVGNYNYQCDIHVGSGMVGTITVQ